MATHLTLLHSALLSLAYSSRTGPDAPADPVDLYVYEALFALYGWQPHAAHVHLPRYARVQADPAQMMPSDNYGSILSRTRIAIRTLARRGLVTVIPGPTYLAGFTLTALGEEEARRLLDAGA